MKKEQLQKNNTKDTSSKLRKFTYSPEALEKGKRFAEAFVQALNKSQKKGN